MSDSPHLLTHIAAPLSPPPALTSDTGRQPRRSPRSPCSQFLKSRPSATGEDLLFQSGSTLVIVRSLCASSSPSSPAPSSHSPARTATLAQPPPRRRPLRAPHRPRRARHPSAPQRLRPPPRSPFIPAGVVGCGGCGSLLLRGRPVAAPPSEEPATAEWETAKEVTVTGSTALGCETKRVRDWVRVYCAKPNDSGAHR